MNLIQPAILGIIQGIGEFLPISSSGHLILVPWIFGWKESGLSFDVALHIGTLIAVILYFWRDWINIFSSFFDEIFKRNKKEDGDDNKKRMNMLWILVIATIPGVLSGLFLEDIIETMLRHPLIVAFNLFFWGLVLYILDIKSKKEKDIKEIGLKEGIIIGLSQALAVIPGTSRSGITISAGLLCGLNRRSAARFSFLMMTPIVLGASIMQLDEFISGFGIDMVVGVLFSFLSGYLAVKYLMQLIEKVSYKVFFWYRLLIAALIVFMYF